MGTNSEKLQCDLVMRGGITSGIVYPRAIAKLAETYNFRSIGGTSPSPRPPQRRRSLGRRRHQTRYSSDRQTILSRFGLDASRKNLPK